MPENIRGRGRGCGKDAEQVEANRIITQTIDGFLRDACLAFELAPGLPICWGLEVQHDLVDDTPILSIVGLLDPDLMKAGQVTPGDFESRALELWTHGAQVIFEKIFSLTVHLQVSTRVVEMPTDMIDLGGFGRRHERRSLEVC